MCDTCASFDFLVEPLKSVGRAEPPPVDGGSSKYGEGLGHILLEPSSELRSSFLVAGHDVAEPPLCLSWLVGIEYAAEVASDLRRMATLGT